jgi:signal transduction histidine kinase/DNA-binding response OmpR family regulator
MKKADFKAMAKAAKSPIRFVSIATWLGLLGLLVAVSALGIFASIKLGNIAALTADATRPDDRLLQVKAVVADLHNAENSVRTFSITLEPYDLGPYYSEALAIDAELDKLFATTAQDSAAQLQVQELDSLVHEKFAVLESVLSLQQNAELDSALAQLTLRMRKAASKLNPKKSAPNKSVNPPRTPPKVDASPEALQFLKAQPFWNQFLVDFKPKATKDKGLKPGDSSNKVPTDSLGGAQTLPKSIEKSKIDSMLLALPIQLSRELSVIRAMENERLALKRADELAYAVHDQQLSDAIEDLVQQIEQRERGMIQAKTDRAQSLAQEANRLILYFCFALGLLLALVGIGIYRYFRTTSRLQASTDAARDAAINLVKARESFIATMSHEIRTPMNAIVGFTKILMKTELGPAQRSQLEMVNASADHLLGLMNAVLDYAKLEAGSMQFERHPFRWERAVRLTHQWMVPQAEAKGLNLLIEIPSDLPVCLVGDGMRLRQVLLNLLSNAIKFTEQGEVLLKVEAVSANAETVKLRFVVQDTGIGIPAEKLGSVWEEFEQVDDSISRKYGGTGLGLPICRRIVEQQGGKIEMESTLGKGTTVSFELEFPVGREEDLEEEVRPQLNTLEGKRVLVVDDEPFNRILLRELLQSRNMGFEEAANGQQALEKFKQQSFDLVLMDVRMPVMGGIEALQLMRQDLDPVKRTLPIVIVSAAANPSEARAWQEAGCDAVLPKPVQEQALWDLLVKLLDTTQAAVPLFSLKALESMSGGNPAFVAEMLQSFLHSLQATLQLLEASEKQNDFPAIGEACHKLAAPAKHLAATQLYEALKQLEKIVEAGGSEKVREGLLHVKAAARPLIPAMQQSLAQLHSVADSSNFTP